MGIESVGGGSQSLNLGAPQEPGYSVQRGDTLSSIARDHGVPLSELIAVNPQILNPNLIYPDQQINLPGGTSVASQGVGATSATASVAAPYTGGKLDRVQLAQVFYQAGFRGEALVQIVAISMRESGGDPRAFNGNAGTGDKSYGLTQINMIGNLGPARREQLGLSSNEALFDPVVNARAAYVLSGNGTDLSPWGGYKGMSNTYNTDIPAARAAVAQAQEQGLLGQPLGNSTASAAPASAQPAASAQPVLREGARGESVEDLQRALKAAGFNPGPVDGWFGPQTERAVLSFQSSRGISVDGVVGPQTWGQLNAATSATLDRGDRDAAVSVLQGRLQELGYSPGPVDGIFGPRTESAVRAFQRDRGIAVDGVVGPQTWGQINGSSPPSVDPPVVDVPDLTGTVPLTNDAATNRAIATLHPEIREQAAQFINRVEQELGIQLRITSGFRSFAEQDALYEQGRSRPGDIVTKARGGQSNHNYGLAFDVVEVNPNGTVNWNTDWNAIGRVGQSMGFEWGGAWTSFTDRPHFQMTFGLSTSQLLARHNAGQTEGGFVVVR